MTQLYKNQAFTIAHADDGKFAGQGLRPFFEYRDLGIKDGTKGKFGAHVIRAVPGMESPAAWHSHDLDFQMVYITKGWVVFEYEGPKEEGGGEHFTYIPCLNDDPAHMTALSAVIDENLKGWLD